jgi:hypothetical protein
VNEDWLHKVTSVFHINDFWNNCEPVRLSAEAEALFRCLWPRLGVVGRFARDKNVCLLNHPELSRAFSLLVKGRGESTSLSTTTRGAYVFWDTSLNEFVLYMQGKSTVS